MVDSRWQGHLLAQLPTRGGGEYEEFRIGDRYVRLPKENLAEEWELLKATVDAFVDRLQKNDNET